MQRTIVCKMNPSAEADGLLRETAKRFADACLFSAKEAARLKIRNKLKLQYAIYRTVRKNFGLSANLSIQAIRRASAAACNKRSRGAKTFRPTSISYDARTFDWRERDEQVSITTIGPRIHVPLALGAYQRDALRGRKPTSATVVRREKRWFANIVIEEDAPKKKRSKEAIGVDRGIYNIAVTSTGKFFSGTKAMHVREKFASRRKALQRLGTRSAKRALKRLSGREHRYMRDVNHCISKAIVAEAVKHRAIIKLEDLTGIRDRTSRFSRVWRRRVHAWAFRELDTMTQYKAELAGTGTVFVPSPNSSRECPRCHVVDEKSRSGAHFRCVACGYRLPADLAAARTISGRHACPERAVVMQPMVSSVLQLHLAPQKQAAGL